VLCPFLASAQTNVGILVNQLALDASNRVAAYESGADMAASQQIYVSNYWNNSFWSSFWSVTTAEFEHMAAADCGY